MGKRTVRLPGIAEPVRVKQTCCRSAPRCKSCPVVAMRLQRLDTAGLSKAKLAKAVKKARRT